MYVFTEPAVIAKSNIILDVKPWDDETGESIDCQPACEFLHK